MRFEHEVFIRHRSVEEVFAYVSDFNRAHEWRTEVTSSTMEPAGPMKEGSRLHEVAVVSGRTVVTDSVVDALDAPHRFTFAHVSGPLPVSGQYLFAPAAGHNGTRMIYLRDVELTGSWKLVAPILRRSGERMMARSMAALVARLAD
jgi:Polyketide cyclase / dehydrase and lipid transport